MNPTLKELCVSRAKIIKRCRKILDSAVKKGRGLSNSQRAIIIKNEKAIDLLDDQILTAIKQLASP